MQLQSILVIVTLVYFQDAFSQTAEEVREAIDSFGNKSNSVLDEGSHQLKPLIAEIEVLSFAVAEIGFIKMNESLSLASKQVDLEEQKDVYVNKCVNETRNNLSNLIKRLSELINNCGANARHEANIINEILNISSIDVNNIIDNYYRNVDACIGSKNETCLDELLGIIHKNTEVYPEELLARLNVTTSSLEDIKTDLGKCVANTDDKASSETKNIMNKMDECIKRINIFD